MPGRLHQQLVAMTPAEMQAELQKTVNVFRLTNDIIGSLLEKVEFLNPTDIHAITLPRHIRSPDQQLGYVGCQYPRLTLEVSHSQNVKNLRRVADDTILMTDANIRMVIGVEIGSRLKNAERADRILVWGRLLSQGAPRFVN